MKFLLLAILAFSALVTVSAGDGGCSMNAGSQLAKCLGIGNDCSKLKDNCHGIKNTVKRAKCYCKWYTRAADCWGAGTCCTEYPAHRAGANRVCKVAKSKRPTAKALIHAVKTAQAVVDQVCHNNCGYDIPCLPEEPMPRHPGGGNCQPRSYWKNGKCTGRHKCGVYKLRRDLDSSALWE